MSPRRFLHAHALLVCVVVLIAVVWVGGRSLLGWQAGRVIEVVGGEHSVVRSALEEASAPVEELPSAIARAAGAKGVWVHGHVGDAHAGYPGELVFHAADAEESRRTRSQADGFYELVLARAGPYAITFEPAESAGLPHEIALSTSIAEREQELALLLPSGAVHGRLVTLSGEPVAGAPVALYRGTLDEGAPEGEPFAATASDAQGRFAFRLLEGGSYHLFARSEEGTRFARQALVLASEEAAPEVELRWPD